MRKRSIEERFFARVEPMMDDRGCWEWNGSLKPGKWNYGKFAIGKHGSGWVTASRISWQIHFGTIPDGLSVLHRCDNPPCVNPNHLFIGTLSDNSKDMVRKCRGNIDEARPIGIEHAAEKRRMKTHCANGHPFDYIRSGGKRGCRACVNAWSKAYRERHAR